MSPRLMLEAQTLVVFSVFPGFPLWVSHDKKSVIEMIVQG